ncbi:MAG: DUF5996 family protein [Melioribacteraceae bacterium]|nr:DUF5996 family protein [Melioribacteraceae bacterium]MCF8355866.1 DUF5996 family protein [Melioribacteraceae bacterium]MCF8393292.1 DUF5996 family protein [Melioribacteraceae bacterium]MCF8419144.1 DUF5996 family protein [Melioribacteraceae bacterium]
MKLQTIDYKEFSKTRNTIQLYAQLLSAVKGKYIPHQKNWEEFSLKTYAKGFTTGPIPIESDNGIEALDLNINLIEHKLKLFFGDKRDEIDLHQTNIKSFTEKVLEKISSYGLEDFEPGEKFFAEDELIYDEEEVNKIWNTFRQIYFLLFQLRGSTLFETSNINFWAHHSDMALLIFSGKIIEGKDPEDWDNSREQMNFGFSSGDEGVGQPYFYITAYPFDEKLFEIELPEFARRQKEGWKGVVVEFDQLHKYSVTENDLVSLMNNLLEQNFTINKE